MLVLTLTNYRPSPRFDDVPWTQARIEQAADREGPWTAIETSDLDPVDVDPENPALRSFTVEYEPAGGLWFRVVFVDADANEQITDAVRATPQPAWTPRSADVAAEIPQRVRDEVGGVAADFSATSTPTKAQVEAIIDKATRDTIAAVGTLEGCDAANAAELREAAKDATVLRAAMRVERGFWPEQIGTDRSPYNAIRDELRDSLKTLIEAVSESGCGGGTGDSVSGAGVHPSSAFPEAVNWETAGW